MTALPPEAVIFDWGGTLTPWHTIDVRDVWRAYARVYSAEVATEMTADIAAEVAEDLAEDLAEELAERLHEAEDAAWAAVRDDHRSATLDELLRSAGVDVEGDRHRAALAAYHEALEPHTWTDPLARPMLESLRERGLRLGLLSNTFWTREHHEAVLARDGVLHLFDGLVFSSELPVTKPHPDAFRAAMAAVGVNDPARVVFVGDRPFDDIHGAQSLGMRAVLVPHSDIPAAQRGHTEADADAVITTLADLVPVVDAWLASPEPGQ